MNIDENEINEAMKEKKYKNKKKEEIQMELNMIKMN